MDEEKNKSNIARKPEGSRESDSCEKRQCSSSDGTDGDQNDAFTATLRAISGLTAGGLRTSQFTGPPKHDYVRHFLRPCRVTDLISPSKLYATSTLSRQRGSAVEMRKINSRRVESDLSKTLKMEKSMQATDRMLTTIAKLEALLEGNLFQGTFKPEGEWNESVRQVVFYLMVR